MSGMMSQRPDQGYNPPASPVPPSQAAGVLRARVVIISGSGVTGLFEYSGTPALGNPPVAYAAAPGVTHDPFGNVLPQSSGGFTTVSGSFFTAMLGSSVEFGGGGPTAPASVAGGTATGVINLVSGTTAALPTQGSLNISPGAVAANPAAVLNAFLRIVSVGAAVSELLGLKQPADTVDRLAIDDNGQLSWGPGGVTAADTTLARTSAGVLTIGSTLIVGTILANKLELTTGAAPAAVSGSVIQAADANGFAITRPDSASGDTTIYNEGHFVSVSTTDELVNSTVFATVCGGGATVAAGKYRVHAELMVTQGPNTASNHFRLGFTGTISQVRAKMIDLQDSASAFVTQTTSNNGLLAAHAFGTGTASYSVTIHAIIITTSTGTLSIQAAMDAATNTFTVLALSDFHLEPLS